MRREREGVRRKGRRKRGRREGVREMEVVTRLDAMHCKTASSPTHSTSHTTPPTQATHISTCTVQITKYDLHLARMLHAQNAYTHMNTHTLTNTRKHMHTHTNTYFMSSAVNT